VTESASLFTDERLVKMAQDLNLDMTAFNQCYQAKRYAADIQADISQAHSLNLTFTPSILVDGKLVQFQNINQLTSAIEAALAGK
jgi:protein-disulfide isomerase